MVQIGGTAAFPPRISRVSADLTIAVAPLVLLLSDSRTIRLVEFKLLLRAECAIHSCAGNSYRVFKINCYTTAAAVNEVHQSGSIKSIEST